MACVQFADSASQERMPADIRLRESTTHNFDEIGFETTPQGQPATLDHLMRDYVSHLKHHLAQIFSAR